MKLIISTPGTGKTTFVKSAGAGEWPQENSDCLKTVDFDYKVRPTSYKGEACNHELQFLHSKLVNSYAKEGFDYFCTFNGWLDWNTVDFTTVQPIWVIPTDECLEEIVNRLVERGDSEEFINEFKEHCKEWRDALKSAADEAMCRMKNGEIRELLPGQYISDVLRDSGNQEPVVEAPEQVEQPTENEEQNDEAPKVEDDPEKV